jgi:hypothetical protein
LSGSIAVTGWALDDVEVREVQIWRDPHPLDPPAAISQGKVFIGYATMVTGARPDVEAQFPAYPFASRAGWGYLMLTRGLVWDGKGPFNLYAYAVDRESHVVLLGSKTIAIDNASSNRPFGAIDTPGPGETVSGLLPNTGWVLTPASGGTIPAANVRVAVDGVFLPDVPSRSDRADISSGFPQFNTTGAGRGLFIDTTRYVDGVHSVGWLVTDTAGNSDGIGSPFFLIGNVPGGSLMAAALAARAPLRRFHLAGDGRFRRPLSAGVLPLGGRRRSGAARGHHSLDAERKPVQVSPTSPRARRRASRSRPGSSTTARRHAGSCR